TSPLWRSKGASTGRPVSPSHWRAVPSAELVTRRGPFPRDAPVGNLPGGPRPPPSFAPVGAVPKPAQTPPAARALPRPVRPVAEAVRRAPSLRPIIQGEAVPPFVEHARGEPRTIRAELGLAPVVALRDSQTGTHSPQFVPQAHGVVGEPLREPGTRTRVPEG